ncbi:MAG TPA: hypothetical protein EYG71_05500, partial [Leucothrix sp.]|nr:hypothetical protein [Leucothrix sp.]
MAMCEERIPIFPIRYTIKAKKEGDPERSYTESDLEKGYPKLKHSQYTTRLLREGFVYIYDGSKGDKAGLQLWKVNPEGTFTELTSLTTIPDSDKEKYKTGHTHTFISACAKSTKAYVGFTDTLWTKDKYADIVANKGNIRDNLMRKINVKQWAGTRTQDGTHKGKDTFPVEKIKDILEEYKNKNWKKDLAWSKRNTQLGFAEPDALKGVMSAIASRGQIVVALHDNIGLLEDQKMIIHHYKSFHAIYVQKHHRKKLIADLIDQVYTQNFATGKSITSNEKLDQFISSEITQLRQSYDRHRTYVSPEYMGDRGRRDYKTNLAEQALKDEPKSAVGYRSAVLTNVAKRQAKHVNEAERLRWLNKYNKDVKKLLKKVIEAKNDRCELLKTYTKTGKPTDVGSSFLTYDKDNPISGGAHAQAFANITEGMMADVSVVSGVKNCEHDLFDQWWQKPLADNPQLVNLRLDDNLLVHVIKNKADTSAGIAGGLDGLGGMLAPNFASSEIMHNLVVYTLVKDPKWRGAVLNNIDNMFKDMLKMPSVAHAEELRSILEGNHQKLTGNYRANVKIEKLSPRAYAKRFGVAADLGEEAIERVLNASGGLKGEQSVLTIAHVQDQAKLKDKLENPFGGKISGAVSLLGILLFAFNLKGAISTYSHDDNGENSFNLGSAAFGLGSSINAMAIAIKPVLGTQAYARYVTHYTLTRTLATVGVMRFFGYLGALFEGITQGIRGYKAHSVGDTDAGNYYALA